MRSVRKGKKLNQFGNWILQQSKSNCEETEWEGEQLREVGRAEEAREMLN